MDNQAKNLRLAALKRFAIAITVLNLAGHFFLGFEQPYFHPIASVITAYAVDIAFESLTAWSLGFRPKYIGSIRTFVEFLLPAHITGLAVAMLLFSNERIMPIIFATTVAIVSKYLFRVQQGRSLRHFFNPSNFGISCALILFPWVGIAPPYQFTENISGLADWIFPAILVIIGSLLNTFFTKRIVLIISWVAGFVLQALIRSYIQDESPFITLAPVTGLAFLLFSFYMISDPGTTPSSRKGQIAFGFIVSAVYGLITAWHVVFGLFFALSIVCAGRGIMLYFLQAREKPAHFAPIIPPNLEVQHQPLHDFNGVVNQIKDGVELPS